MTIFCYQFLVSLTETRKKGLESKQKLIESVSQCIDYNILSIHSIPSLSVLHTCYTNSMNSLYEPNIAINTDRNVALVHLAIGPINLRFTEIL